jgi:hypothetical protein
VTLQEQADLGTGDTGVPILGAQTVDGKAELVFTDEDDNDIQITSSGNIDGSNVRIDNDEYLKSTDNAGTGTVDLIKATTSDTVEFGADIVRDGKATIDNVNLPEGTAPSTAANEGALYTKDTGGQPELFYREESNGDEVQITNDGALNNTSQSAVVNVNVTSSGNKSITGIGFQPVSIVFSTFCGTSGRFAQGNGFVDSSLNERSTWFERKADGATSGGSASGSIKCGGSTGSFTEVFQFTVSSMDSDGFTVNVSTADANGVCYALCSA